MRSVLRTLFLGSLALSGWNPASAAPVDERIQLTFDPPLPYSDQPIHLTATVIIGECDSLSGFERSGNRFELGVQPCPILPPPGSQEVTFTQNLGQLPAGTYTFHYAGSEDELGRLTVLSAEGLCAPSASALCLDGRRFRAELSFAAGGVPGVGQAVPQSDQAGYFWFFNPENVEVLVKVLDGCALNGHFWVFAAGLTNVQATLTVTDFSNGAQSVYTSPADTPFQPLQNTVAFPCAP
jgi:hypothetical protein